MTTGYVRVRKARWPGLCSLCGGAVIIGQQVAETGPDDWAHAWCVIKLAGLAPTGTGS